MGSAWVDTYDLVAVRLLMPGCRWALRLTDSAGRTVLAPVGPLQANQRLWALVYNGILHSALAREMKTNGLACRDLHLPIS